MKQSSDKEEKCTFYGKEGHKSNGCFKKIGYPDWWPGKKDKPKAKAACVEVGPNPIPGLTDEHYRLFVAHFREDEAPKANLAGRTNTYDGWVVESGATEHITHRSDFFDNRVTNTKETHVIIPNGDKVPVMGEGEHTLPGGLKIDSVLHVSNFNYNLLSVNKLARNLNCVVTFFPDFFVVQKISDEGLDWCW